ncbi:translation initiation factor IF-2-like [Choloepus didactylus]|uniref:translation initiation factor IF-2-like n=1 Tax=Choloepus didactylus TaxID=27675 RepID=UPI00189E4BEC|nr:translation initiation factor IF-2-like [Choloepus didactylus]XP_037666668.1 translation initiation factor IF-2-like [Choloepus didactylus]
MRAEEERSSRRRAWSREGTLYPFGAGVPSFPAIPGGEPRRRSSVHGGGLCPGPRNARDSHSGGAWTPPRAPCTRPPGTAPGPPAGRCRQNGARRSLLQDFRSSRPTWAHGAARGGREGLRRPPRQCPSPGPAWPGLLGGGAGSIRPPQPRRRDTRGPAPLGAAALSVSFANTLSRVPSCKPAGSGLRKTFSVPPSVDAWKTCGVRGRPCCTPWTSLCPRRGPGRPGTFRQRLSTGRGL